MKLVVGLGNPGQKYNGTRHNVGFEVIAELARRHFSGRVKNRFNGEIAEITLAGEKVLLTCPLTYMNLSGQFVGSMIDFYKLTPEQIMVVCDDFNLPLAQLRIRTKGSAGGQKGLNDIIKRLGTQEIPRLRFGVGPVPERWNPADFVLGKFSEDEKPIVEQNIRASADAIEHWNNSGIESMMNRFNKSVDKKNDKPEGTSQSDCDKPGQDSKLN